MEAKKGPGRPKRRLQEPRQDTHSTVLDAAEAALTARGYAGMALEEVARQSGVSKAALYHHFPEGKDALILAVALRMLEREREGVARAIAAAPSARDQMIATARWVLSENRHSARMLRDAQRFLPPEHSENIGLRFLECVYVPLEQVLKRGAASGELRAHDTEFVTWAFLSLLGEFAALPEEFPSDFPEGYPAPDLGGQIVELLLNGIGHTPLPK